MKYLIFFLIALVVIAGVAFLYFREGGERDNAIGSLTSDECVERGGAVINTLNPAFSYSPDEILGEIDEVRCPCVCIKKKTGTSEEFFLAE